MEDWYPKKLRVPPHGTPGTVTGVLEAFGKQDSFHYAELGIYEGSTALAILQKRPQAQVSLFDYASQLEAMSPKFDDYADRVTFYPNSPRHLDSYNWPLMQMIVADKEPQFDYVFLDGAHTFAIDGLSFFLCDRLLKPGGYLDFDDYTWRLRGSSLDPSKVPETAQQYTDEQIDAAQVRMIVDHLVKPDPRYREVQRNKIYQKIA